MTTIMQQQIELELADQYDDALDRARKYVKSVMRSSWLAPTSKRKADTAEGGRSGLVRRCMCFIIENEDIDKGLSEFGNYIMREYGKGASADTGDNYNVSLKPYTTGVPITLGEWATKSIDDSLSVVAAETLFGVSPRRSGASVGDAFIAREGDVEQIAPVDEVLKTAEERKLFQTYGDCGSLAEAIRLLGWDKDDAMRIWWRVHQRAKRAGLH